MKQQAEIQVDLSGATLVDHTVMKSWKNWRKTCPRRAAASGSSDLTATGSFPPTLMPREFCAWHEGIF